MSLPLPHPAALAVVTVTALVLAPREPLLGQETSVRQVLDVPYAQGPGYEEGRGLLDLYLPEHAEGFPVLVSLHGGGLVQGGKEEERHIGRRFAGAGVGTVVVNYRLSPAVSHPEHARDVARALAWVRANIAAYGGDPDALFLMGHSAGGYLTGLLATDLRFLEEAGLPRTALRGAIPVSGFFYVDEVAPDRPEHVWGTDPAVWLEASPHTHLRRDAPPILLLYADGDAPCRREQHRRFAADLREAGHGDVGVEEFPDRSHSGIWEGMAAPEAVSEGILDFIWSRAGG